MNYACIFGRQRKESEMPPVPEADMGTMSDEDYKK